MSAKFIGKYTAYICLIVFISLPSRALLAQKNFPYSTEYGIQLYKAGKFNEAVEALRAATKTHKDDADAWYYLGLSLNRAGDAKNARKAFERAISLRPDFAGAHAALAYIFLINGKLSDAEKEAARAGELDPNNFEVPYIAGAVSLREGSPETALKKAEAALKLNPNYAIANLLKAEALFHIYAKTEDQLLDVRMYNNQSADKNKLAEIRALQTARLNEAAKSLERYLQLNPNSALANFWRDQLETIKFYARVGENSADVFSTKDVTTKAVILSKPEPGFTAEARQHNVEGIVRLKAVLGADGKVSHILVIQHLGYGLDEKAAAAAQQVKFIPAMKDGRNVSQIVTFEYHFNVY